MPHTRNRPKRAQIIFYCAFPVDLPHFEPRDDIRNFTCFPTCPFVAHGTVIDPVISTWKSWSVSSCRVSFKLATTYGVVSAVLLVSSHRSAVSCFAMSCLSDHKRSFFSRCHHSPDDVMWWRSATRHVLVATGTSATQIMSPIRFRHCATSSGEQTAHATAALPTSIRTAVLRCSARDPGVAA